MKKILSIAFYLTVGVLGCSSCGGDEPNENKPNNPEKNTMLEMTLATYNLKVQNENKVEADNDWKVRSPHLVRVIQTRNFEIFGTQEGLKYQLDYIKSSLPNFNYIGVGRDNGSTGGEYAAIFYDTTKFELLDSGNFWLSATPDKVSYGWDASYRRVCTWGKFKHKESGKSFLYLNTHLDCDGVIARRESAKLILNKIEEIGGGMPAIVSGDMNVDQTDEVYKLLHTSDKLKDSYMMTVNPVITKSTYNGFEPNKNWKASNGELERIDHIFISNEFIVRSYVVVVDNYTITDNSGNAVTKVPSDHYPVRVQLVIK